MDSYCPNCGFRAEQLLLTCPRCLEALRHNHCSRCRRCPQGKTPYDKTNTPVKQ